MSRVAILGSCITRDLWPVRGAGVTDVAYVSRTSLPSLFARPAAGFRPRHEPPNGLGRHQHIALVADLTKTGLHRLVAFRPTHLILDLIDERFDLMRAGGAVLTHSWELEASGYLRQPALADAVDIPRLSGGCDRLWNDGAETFAAFINATPLKGAKLILHSARWAERSRSRDGGLADVTDVEVLPGRPAAIAAHNDLLARYEARLGQLFPALLRVEAPQWRLADADHRWGLSPFHYVPEYYAAIWTQLSALGIARPAEAMTGAA